MCQMVILGEKRHEIETPRQLLSFLPDLKLVKNEMYNEIDMDSCLCPVDLDETFDNANIKYEKLCMTYVIEKCI